MKRHKIAIRVPKDVFRAARAAAKREGLSFNAYTTAALQHALRGVKKS